jgi:predicted AlkP superfamily phosphohydrolase/phosphomutase
MILEEKRLKRVFVFGIDGAMPEKVFGEWLNELPNIKKLIGGGCHARLNSTIPPLSGAAWTSIVTGRSPADNGIFEYTYRKGKTYSEFGLISSKNVKQKTIWEILSERGRKTVSCFVPLTWPIKPFNGVLVSGFMTPPGEDIEYCYPRKIKQEIKALLGEDLLIDVKNFRQLSKKEIIEEVYKVSKMHIDSIKYLMEKEDWELFIGVINGSDRLNHSFWRYCDEGHRRYEADSKFRDTLKDYYIYLDDKIGDLLKNINEEDTIIVMSDHGITRMHTRVNLTDWLIKEGYMVLKRPIAIKTEFSPEMVDWKKTKLFATGAYDGEITVNLKGREPDGVVSPGEYDQLLEELEKKLKQIKGDDGKKLDTKIFKKKEYFQGEGSEMAPDMIVYFDDLQYGCNTSLVGNDSLWSLATAKGSDDAGHSRQGIFIMKNGTTKGDLGEIDILDVAPTILNELNVVDIKGLSGKIVK